MKPEIASKLADTLESGKYQQGTGRLVGEGKYCCLGVLCELAIEAGVPGLKYIRHSSGVEGYTDDPAYSDETSLCCSFPPNAVSEWSEMEKYHGEDILASKNDAGESFAEIARYLRDTYVHQS